MSIARSLSRLLVPACLALCAPAMAATLVLEPVADNAMYSEDGDLANGAGAWIFAGRIARDDLRRALIRFDLSALPSGATVDSAELQLSMSRSIAPELPVTLHRVLASWGEGDSDAGDPGGLGATASDGDATWTLRAKPGLAWTTPGGDFAPAASASTPVAGIGDYAWSGPGLLADIEAWRQDPSANHGWIVIGDETQTSARRFDSREHPDPDSRPRLVIEYTAAAAPAPISGAVTVPALAWGTLGLLAFGLMALAAGMHFLRR